jgi:hypothetical protein
VQGEFVLMKKPDRKGDRRDIDWFLYRRGCAPAAVVAHRKGQAKMERNLIIG